VPDQFVPGYVFANRYRIVTLLGQAGSAEVWQADDLVLQTPVALKLMPSAGPQERERVLKEVRLARSITHPAVCPVFDVAEAEGRVFYSRELVAGEDLGALVRRVGGLPPERVVEIGVQICAGLAAAHAQGVVHGNLTPANVLIDENGTARLIDFGIAEGPTSERADVQAVAAILLDLAGGADRRLARVIRKSLDENPERRPSAASLAEHLLTATAAERTGGRFWVGAATVLASVLAAALLFSIFFRGPVAALTDQDTIVVADFVNTTGETVFNGTLKVALAVALEQSPFLKVFPDDRVRETLRLMEREPAEAVTRSLAREIAQREQLKALVAGSIGRLGANYVLTLEAINADSGEALAREQIEVASKEEVIGSLGTATSRLRAKLGESLASITQFDAPLPRATTTSLEALHAYALALDQGRAVPRVEAIPHLQRAIQLDPDFALAQAQLSNVYRNYGRSADAPAFSRRAFELRDRVSERERFFISWRYYVDAVQAWDKALELAQAWTTTYPREAFAFNSLGIATGAFGQYERAIDALREAIRLDPGFATPYGNLVTYLIALDRYDEAAVQLGEARRRGLGFMMLRQTEYLLPFIGGDQAGTQRALDESRASTPAMWQSTWEARTLVYSGRVAAAHQLYQRAIQDAVRDNFPELAARWTLEDAEAHAVVEQCGPARAEAAAGLGLSRDNFTLERAARTLALCRGDAEASALERELAQRFPEAALTIRVQRPVSAAVRALRRGDAAGAVTLLDPVAPYDRSPSAEFWPPYVRGLAFLRQNDGSRARAEFDRILSNRGAAPTSPLYALARLGAARAASLSGDVAGARMSYEDLLSLWRDADSTLPPLDDARREYARLQ
jgi:tetratricopeptide (TPR) repeat protein